MVNGQVFKDEILHLLVREGEEEWKIWRNVRKTLKYFPIEQHTPSFEFKQRDSSFRIRSLYFARMHAPKQFKSLQFHG